MGDLKELNLGDNVIKIIPDDLSELYLLENLDLSGNLLSSDN